MSSSSLTNGILTPRTSTPLRAYFRFQVLSGQGAKAAASARLVAAFLPRMCMDGVCPAWRPGGAVDIHDVVMSRYYRLKESFIKKPKACASPPKGVS